MQLPAFSMPCFFHTRGAKLLAGRQHDEGLPASFAFPHRFSKHDRCSRLPALHVVAPALTTFLDTAFLAIKRARSTDELLAAQDAAPRCQCIRLHPLFSTLWAVPRPRTGYELFAAVSADDLLHPFQDLLLFRQHAFPFLQNGPLFAKDGKPCRRIRGLQRFFLPFPIHVAATAFAVSFSPALRTKTCSRSSYELRATVLADMLYKFHQAITLFHQNDDNACRSSSVNTITFRYPTSSSAKKIFCCTSSLLGVTAITIASCSQSAETDCHAQTAIPAISVGFPSIWLTKTPDREIP